MLASFIYSLFVELLRIKKQIVKVLQQYR